MYPTSGRRVTPCLIRPLSNPSGALWRSVPHRTVSSFRPMCLNDSESYSIVQGKYGSASCRHVDHVQPLLLSVPPMRPDRLSSQRIQRSHRTELHALECPIHKVPRHHPSARARGRRCSNVPQSPGRESRPPPKTRRSTP